MLECFSQKSLHRNAKEVENKPIRNAIVTEVHSNRKKEVFSVSLVVDRRRYATPIGDKELLDIIEHGGIQKGGLIKEPLVWVGSGKYPKLTRLGSDTYEFYRRKQELSNKGPIKRNLLKVGSIYETQAEWKGVYLGQVNTIAFIEQPKFSGIIYCRERQNQMLWMECSPEVPEHESALTTYIKNPKQLILNSRCQLKVKASHTFKLDREETIDIPLNIVELLREMYLRELQQCIKLRLLWSWGLCDNSKYLNMVPVTEKPILKTKTVEDIKSYQAHRFILIDFVTLAELPGLLTHEREEVRGAAIERAEQLGVTKEDLDERS